MMDCQSERGLNLKARGRLVGVVDVRPTQNPLYCDFPVSCPSMIPNELSACALDLRPLSKGSEKSISDLAGYISNGGTGYVHSLDFECCLSIKTISHNQNVAIVLNANEHQKRTHIKRIISNLHDSAIILNDGLPEQARMDLRGPVVCAVP